MFSISSPRFILNDTIDFGEESIVLPHPDIFSRMDSSSDLADEDASRLNLFPAEVLHAQALPRTVSTVSRAAACLLMCHIFSCMERQFWPFS